MAEQLYGIRKYLRDNGYGDDDITYDMNSRTVQLKGKDFYKTNPQAQTNPEYGLQQGSTYATQSELSKALRDYRGSDRTNQINNTVNNMTQSANREPFQYKAPQPFNYNVEDDPQYKAALRRAEVNSQRAVGNISADMNKRGLLNSTITKDRGDQSALQEFGRASDFAITQLIPQAYQQYADQANRDLQVQGMNYQAGQDQFKNQSALAQLLNGLNQQDTDNAYREDVLANQQKNERIGLAQWLSQTYGVDAQPKYDTQVAFNQVTGMKPLNAQQFDWQKVINDRDFNRGNFENDRAYGLQQSMQNAQIGSMGYNDALKGRQTTLDEAKFGYESNQVPQQKYSVDSNGLQRMLYSQFGVKDDKGNVSIPAQRIAEVKEAIANAPASTDDKIFIFKMFGIEPPK
ncbi:hypothetical protein ACFC0X_25065 [Paenibacillus chitinolyticus]|uniref:hypothetical protein n=1 Tax=Paenibacillus chitinolyticus TaxID=79263 RepID=UPI0035E31C82